MARRRRGKTERGDGLGAAVALLDHVVAAGRPMRRGRVAAALGEAAAPTGGCL